MISFVGKLPLLFPPLLDKVKNRFNFDLFLTVYYITMLLNVPRMNFNAGQFTKMCQFIVQSFTPSGKIDIDFYNDMVFP